MYALSIPSCNNDVFYRPALLPKLRETYFFCTAIFNIHVMRMKERGS